MRLNNKGTTIIELVISVALLAIVLIFMYQLLNNITFEKNTEYFASKNQEQRIEIIDAIEEMLDYSGGINTYTSGNSINIHITGSTITVGTQTWNIGDYDFGSLSIKCTLLKSNQYLCQGTIPIYTDNTENNADNNNIIDDITFSFFNRNDI